ncbi:MAG TPA: VOC family protein [Longimicrobiales bacterium]
MNDYGIPPADYRLPDALRLGTVRLQVSDLDRSLAFYEGLLGMHLIEGDRAGVRLGTAFGAEPLIELRPGAEARASRKGRLGLYHVAVLLPDRAALGRLLAHLMESGVHPGAADHLVSEALYLQDPDDLGIELYRDRPRSEWESRHRQLVMSTDPLDGHGVVAAAEGAAWSGMPAGTSIGHVHLHVGDIAHARAFYHEALGFDVVVWSYPGALFMSAGGYHHHLGVNTWAGAHALPPSDGEPRLLGWDLVLPSPADVAAAAESLERHGHAASPEDIGGSVVIDPWGTPLRLVPETRTD